MLVAAAPRGDVSVECAVASRTPTRELGRRRFLSDWSSDFAGLKSSQARCFMAIPLAPMGSRCWPP
eukprot:7005190-Pyramimonas_sp.AAC.1